MIKKKIYAALLVIVTLSSIVIYFSYRRWSELKLISESLIIQDGNTLPTTSITTKKSSELPDNHIGGDYGSDDHGSLESTASV